MKKRIIYIIFGLIGIGVGMGTLPPLWDLIGWADNHYFNSVLWLRCTAEYLPTTHHHAIIRLLGFSGGYDTQRRMAAAFEFP